MEASASTINRVLFVICGVATTVPCLFFTLYTLRLIYVNLTMSAEDAAIHRTGGMLIGAIAFPVAAIIFGYLSWHFIKKARRSPGQNQER